MAKKKTTSKKYKKEIIDNTSYKENIKKVVIALVVVLAFLGIFYLLTVYLTSKDDLDFSKKVGDAVVQYEEIIAGSSFNIDKPEYIVIYYDKSNDEYRSEITPAISSYQEKADKLSLYTVDMSNAFNKQFASDESNNNPLNVNDLKISQPTLIKFSDGRVSEYVEGVSSIVEYLQ